VFELFFGIERVKSVLQLAARLSASGSLYLLLKPKFETLAGLFVFSWHNKWDYTIQCTSRTAAFDTGNSVLNSYRSTKILDSGSPTYKRWISTKAPWS